MMRKTLISFLLLASSSLKGMEPVLKVDEQKTLIRFCDKTYTHLVVASQKDSSKPSSRYPFMIPSYCLPTGFDNHDNTIPMFTLHKELRVFLVEALASLRLFPNNEPSLKLLKMKLLKILKAHPEKEVIEELVQAVGYLAFPEKFKKMVHAVYLALSEKPSKPRVNVGPLQLAFQVKRSAPKNEEEAYLLDEVHEYGKQKSPKSKSPKQRSKGNGIFYLKPHALLLFNSNDEVPLEFPLYRAFFSVSFCKKIDRLQANLDNIPSYNKRVKLNLSKFDGDILAMIVPLIIDYYVLKEHKKSDEDIVAKCAESLAEAFFTYSEKSNKQARLFQKALDFFELKPLADFYRKLSDAPINLPLTCLNDAQKCMKALEFEKVFSPRLLMSISNVIARRLNYPQLSALHTALALENVKSVVNGDEIISSKVIPVDLEPNEEMRQTTAQYFKQHLMNQLQPTGEHKRRIALNFLQSSTPYLFQQGVLDCQSWQDLELFCGQKKSPSQYVAAQLPTATELGKVFAYRTIADCTTDMNELAKRTRKVRVLSESQYFPELEKAFKELGEAEAGVFSFWHEEDYFERMLDEYLYKFIGLDRKLKCAKTCCDYLNTNSAALELAERFHQLKLAATMPAAIAAGVLPGALLIGLNVVKPKKANLFAAQGVGFDVLDSINVAAGGLSLLKLLPELLGDYPEMVRQTAYFRICIRIKLIHLARYFKAMDNLCEVLKKVDTKDGLFKDYIKRCDFANSSKEIQKLRDKLQTKTFVGDACFPKESVKTTFGIFTYCTGRILAAFNIMRHHKNTLVPMISAIGELDTVMTASRLLRYSKGNSVRWCIPEYLSSRDNPFPYISIEDSWNPIIDPTKVKVNSLDIGLGSDAPQNVIINGPNAGGKSSIMKGIAFNIIFAQSLGVAPAKHLSFTPFHRIQAYLNITDDQAGGDSLFKASVKRALALYDTVRLLPDGQFSLTVFDEVFNGTSTAEGEAAAYALLEKLGKQERNLCIITTHFKSLLNLADRYPDDFMNCKVTVRLVDGKLQYPFKLDKGELQFDEEGSFVGGDLVDKGKSNQHIAFDILKEEGFDKDYVDRCRELLETMTESPTTSKRHTLPVKLASKK